MPTLDFTNRKTLTELETLPKPTNENLKTLFTNIDKIVIKKGGVYKGRATGKDIVLSINDENSLSQFGALLEIDERNTGFYCLCLGDYAIELYCNNILQATIGYHHGISIRYDNWRGDAALAKTDELLQFLHEQGLVKPLLDRIKAKEMQTESYKAEQAWRSIAPECFSKYMAEMNHFNNNFIPQLIKDLNKELPDRNAQVIKLLQTFGRSNNLWTGYPIYEELPNTLLKKYDFKAIIDAYLMSDRNYKTRIGLGRFLCSFEFKKTRKEYLQNIPQVVIDDLQKCFKFLKEERGIEEIAKLNLEKQQSTTP